MGQGKKDIEEKGINTIKEIYQKLEDDISKTVFSNRLLYNLTGDSRYILQMTGEFPEAKNFYELMDEQEIFIRGGGNIWCRLMGKRAVPDNEGLPLEMLC